MLRFAVDADIPSHWAMRMHAPWGDVDASAACQCESTDHSVGISTAMAYMSLLVKSAPKP